MKEKSIAYSILEGLEEMGGVLSVLLPRPFETKYAWAKRIRNADPNSVRRTVVRLRAKGYLEVVQKNGKKFLQLTGKGEIEALIQKISVTRTHRWDGKWRLLMFDIPENCKEKRALLRALLKKNNFFRIQGSVYISPYSFNREGVLYLQKSMLINYIRIMKVEEMDNDATLRKKFGL
jgi:CRISPR-associated endonuclease Cas2